MPSILADIYWAGSLLPEILMILFTQLTAALHKYLNDELKIICLLQFFPEVAQNSLSFPCSEKSPSIPGFPCLLPPFWWRGLISRRLWKFSPLWKDAHVRNKSTTFCYCLTGLIVWSYSLLLQRHDLQELLPQVHYRTDILSVAPTNSVKAKVTIVPDFIWTPGQSRILTAWENY